GARQEPRRHTGASLPLSPRLPERTMRAERVPAPHGSPYHEAVAITAGTKKLNAHTVRADFPIFKQEIHGKPLAFLDSAASSQKPRQMLEAMTTFYETSYANVHRG